MSREYEFDITPHIRPTDKTLNGMPLEVEGFDNPVYANWQKWLDRAWGERARITEEGKLPYTGPALFIATHTRTESTAILPWISADLVRRPIQVVAKDTLLYPALTESEKVVERTGSDNGGIVSRKDLFFSKAAIAANSIPIERGDFGEENKARFRDIKSILDNGHLIGFFLQESRIKDGDLTNPMVGAAYLAYKNPEVPLYLVSMAKTRYPLLKLVPSRAPSLRIRNIGTYNQIAENKRPGLRELTDIFTENLGEMLLNDLSEVRLPNGRIISNNEDPAVDDNVKRGSVSNT